MLFLIVKGLLVYAIISLLTWIYKKHRKLQTFRRRNIKGPEPSLFFGNFMALKGSPENKLPHEVMSEWIDQYGNIFGYYSPNRCRLVVNDPYLLKKISVHKSFQDRELLVLDVAPLKYSLFATGGETWRRSRKTLSPLLSRFKVNSPPYSTVVPECVNTYLKHLRPVDTPPESEFIVDINMNIHRLTLDVICRTSLGMESECYSENDPLFKAVAEFFENAFNNAVLLAEAFPVFSYLLTFVNNHLTAGKMTDLIVNFLKRQINELINSKSRKSSDDDDDSKAIFLKSMLKYLAEGKLNENEFMGNMYLIVLAGYETTANALIFCLYLIAKHQHVQDKIRDCLNEENENESYIEMVWLETLRYYPPPSFILNRMASEDVDIDGLTIEKDWVIEVPVWQIHHSEKYWPDPWKFDPERFSVENRKNIVPLSFLPFGFGGRLCLGMNLANLEARQLISELISKYRISFCDKTLDPLEFKVPASILNPKGPVYLKFEPIN